MTETLLQLMIDDTNTLITIKDQQIAKLQAENDKLVALLAEAVKIVDALTKGEVEDE